MFLIITFISLGVSCIGCIIWSNITKDKTLDIILTTISFMCLFFAFVTLGFAASLPERDTAEAAKIETSEGEQKLEIVPIDTSANITITTESLTDEQLIKAFIEKWDGVLPDTIIINVGGADNGATVQTELPG